MNENQKTGSQNTQNQLATLRLIADYTEWSGGFTPTECMPDEIRSYVESNVREEDQEAALKTLLVK